MSGYHRSDPYVVRRSNWSGFSYLQRCARAEYQERREAARDARLKAEAAARQELIGYSPSGLPLPDTSGDEDWVTDLARQESEALANEWDREMDWVEARQMLLDYLAPPEYEAG